jgi:hypothetical protein
MTSADHDIALRKNLLVAKSALSRLHIRHETHALRESLSWRHAGTAAMASPTARSALFLVALEGLGTERVTRWLAIARRSLVIAKLTAAAIALVRHKPADPETIPD